MYKETHLNHIFTKTEMGRSPCCSEQGLRRGAWTAEEDQLLIDFIKANGKGRWRNIPQKAGLRRCGKSCRLRWLNYLRPDIKRGNITPDEEELITRLHKLLGNRWSLIAGRLPGRTDNEIKNYWNKTLGKRADQNNSTISPLSPTQENSNQPRSNNHDDNIVLHPPTATMPIRTNSHGPGKVLECFDGNGRDNHINDRDNLSEDFMMDFNVGELNYLSDLLNTDQPLLFSDELIPDHWNNLNIDNL